MKVAWRSSTVFRSPSSSAFSVERISPDVLDLAILLTWNLNSTQYQFTMSLVAKLYNNVLRRSSTYALAIVSGAFFFERAFDMATEHLYSEMNRGVSCKKCTIFNEANYSNYTSFQKLWKDIKDKYETAEWKYFGQGWRKTAD